MQENKKKKHTVTKVVGTKRKGFDKRKELQ